MFDVGGAWETRSALVETLRAQHRGVAIAQATEVATVTALYHQHVAADVATGINAAHAGEFATTQAANATFMTEAVASGLIDLGLALEQLPATRAAFARGDIDLARAKVIADALINLSPELITELEQRLADAARSCNAVRLRQTARRWIAAADPDGDRDRRERRTEDRDVRIRAAQDGMSVLDGFLPAAGAQTLAMRLRDMAMTVCCHDRRTFAQRRADALVALADGTGQLRCACGRSDFTQRVPESGVPRPAGKPLIQVGVSLDTLLGLAEYPGFLAGYGAIDADLARRLTADGTWELIIAAATAAAPHHDGTPDSGPLDDPNSERAQVYRPSAELDRWIRARDGHCRFPGCVVPAANCDIDHSRRFNRKQRRKGGKTIRRNLACLCRRHHRLKVRREARVFRMGVRDPDPRVVTAA